MEEAFIYSNHSKIHESSVATSNPNKNRFSSALSWRAQAYTMEMKEKKIQRGRWSCSHKP